MNRKVIITSPSLDLQINISGISSVTQFIINHAEPGYEYIHFELGKRDGEKRNALWFLRILKTYLKWAVLITKKNITIHFNLSLEKRSLLRDSPLILLGRIFKKRMILHIHGGEILNRTDNPKWIKWILRLNFSGNYPILVSSSVEQEVIKKYTKRDQIFVLPNCIETEEANGFNRVFEDTEPIVLLFLGRIVLTKGIEYLYQALKVLKEKGINFKFILAGKGPGELEYVQKFSALLGKDFEFKGVVSGNDKIAVLKESHVFLLPSFFEGLPMALLESMSFGLVPVTTNVGSIHYVIEDTVNGIFINKYSAPDITAAVECLAGNIKYREKLSLNAKAYIQRNYDSSAYMRILNKIYNYE